MSKLWAGITSGILAGAAGATAQNAISYLDQVAQDDVPPSSPNGAPAQTAASVAAKAGHDLGGARSSALGNLGGLGIGVGSVPLPVRSGAATSRPTRWWRQR